MHDLIMYAYLSVMHDFICMHIGYNAYCITMRWMCSGGSEFSLHRTSGI